jgi:uncharacterized membrane protein YfcA
VHADRRARHRAARRARHLTEAILLAGVAAGVGLLIGTVGVGGVLMIAYLALHGGMSGGLTIHQAAATSLFSFLFAGLLGTWLYHRRGSIDWGISLPVCAAGLIFGWLGAFAAARVDARPLAVVIALLIVAAGVHVLLPVHANPRERKGRNFLLAVGAASGFGSGFSGAGGPVFSVPMMVILGYAPLTAIATSQALQMVAAASGSAANLFHGTIDYKNAALITVFELAGVAAGVRVAHFANAQALRMLAGALCVLSGGALLARSL